MTKYYDSTGRRVPGPRHDSVPSTSMTALLVFAIILFVSVITMFLYNKNETTQTTNIDAPSHLITHDSLTAVHTYDGETIRFYVMTDPDTGKQYLVDDRGGMCLREEQDVEQDY